MSDSGPAAPTAIPAAAPAAPPAPVKVRSLASLASLASEAEAENDSSRGTTRAEVLEQDLAGLEDELALCTAARQGIVKKRSRADAGERLGYDIRRGFEILLFVLVFVYVSAFCKALLLTDDTAVPLIAVAAASACLAGWFYSLVRAWWGRTVLVCGQLYERRLQPRLQRWHLALLATTDRLQQGRLAGTRVQL